MQSLSGIEIFTRVVESGSFTAAADQLGVSKSLVSKQVSRLEQSVGIKLLNRTTRRLSLTEAGQLYYDYCRQVALTLEEAESALARLHNEPRGKLKISGPMSFGMLHLAPHLTEFLTRFPELDIELSLSDRLINLKEEGVDLAIRIAQTPSPHEYAVALAPIKWVVCATPDYLIRQGLPSEPAALAQHNCLIYPGMAAGDQWNFQSGVISVHGNFQADNSVTLREAALAGLGIALLPTFVVGNELSQGKLTPLFVGQVVQQDTLYAIAQSPAQLTTKAKLFIDYLTSRFGDLPYWDRWRLKDNYPATINNTNAL